MSGTMNGVPFARRELKAPLLRGSKFARIAAEAKQIVDEAKKAGLVKCEPNEPLEMRGICPSCNSPSRMGTQLCSPCRGKIIGRTVLARQYPPRMVQCRCGVVFETRQPSQMWCKPSCIKATKRLQERTWNPEAVCVECNKQFTRSRPHARRCGRCSKNKPRQR